MAIVCFSPPASAAFQLLVHLGRGSLPFKLHVCGCISGQRHAAPDSLKAQKSWVLVFCEVGCEAAAPFQTSTASRFQGVRDDEDEKPLRMRSCCFGNCWYSLPALSLRFIGCKQVSSFSRGHRKWWKRRKRTQVFGASSFADYPRS